MNEEPPVSKRAQPANERQALVAALRSEQLRKARRRTRLFVGAAAAILLVLVVATVFMIVRDQGRKAQEATAAKGPIAGVIEYPNLSRNHVTGSVAYPQTPPVGGDHAEVWTTCAVYTTPLKNEQAVHSLEHGAVWVTYRPDLPADQVSLLAGVVSKYPYGLMSPFPGLSSPVVASAWGLQLSLNSATDPRLQEFVAKYQNGPQTPEAGASCAGGAGAG
jgi:hypothetical protein